MTKLLLFIFLSSIMMPLHSCKNQEQEFNITWRIAGRLPPPPGKEKAIGVAGPVAGLTNNMLLVAGGANFPDGFPWMGGKKKYYNQGFIYKKDANDSLELVKTIVLPDSIAYAAAVSTPHGIVIAGGENAKGAITNVYLAQWIAGEDTLLFHALKNLPLPLSNAGITTIGHSVYLVGGENAEAVSAGFYTLDISDAENQWKTLPPFPYPVSHAVVTAGEKGDPSIYVFGGRKRNLNGISNLYNGAWRFNPSAQKWEQLQPLPYALCAGTGIAYGNNAIYLFGGDRGETFHKTEELIAAIQSATDEKQKKQLILTRNTVQESHPGFSSDILVYHPAANSWSVAGAIPFDVPATTTALVWDNQVLIPSGEIRAGVRTDQILSARFNR